MPDLKPGQLFCPEHEVGYWPNQAWIHKGCEEVVHEESPVVVHSRHGKYSDLEKRKTYRREWMRRRRGEAR